MLIHKPHRIRTHAAAALAIRFQHPSLIARALHIVFVLLTLLTALEVLGTIALDLAGLVVSTELHTQWAGARNTFTRGYCTVVATASIVESTEVCNEGHHRGSLGEMWPRLKCFPSYQ